MERDDQYYKVIELSRLPAQGGTLVYANFKKFALFQIDGELHCTQNHCPHAGASLAMGSLKGCVVKCPRHDWGFDVTDGSCTTNPRYSVKRYATRVEDGWVYVGLPDEQF